MTPYMYTYPSGQRVNPLDVQESEIQIEDIAHHLSLINRFNGATAHAISVAHHSVYVSKLCGNSRKAMLQGLLHDASETYLGDITKWLKQSIAFTEFRVVEMRLQRRIFSMFGCPTIILPEVEQADRLMVRFEMEQECAVTKILLPGTKKLHPDYPPLTVKEKESVGWWIAWSAIQAEGSFLAAFRGLVENDN